MMSAERGCRNMFPFLRLIREGKKARPAACRKENARACERGEENRGKDISESRACSPRPCGKSGQTEGDIFSAGISAF